MPAGTLNHVGMKTLVGLVPVLPWLGGSLLMASAFALTLVPWLAGEPRLWQLVSCAGAALLALSPAERPVAFVLGLLLPYVSVEPAPFDFAFGVLLALRWVRGAVRAGFRSLFRDVTASLRAGDGWLLLFLGANVVSVAVGGGSWRYLGLTVYMIALYLLTRGWDATVSAGLVYGYVVGSLAELLVAVVWRIAGAPFRTTVMYEFVRAKGTFKDPNLFGAYYVPLFLGALALAIPAAGAGHHGKKAVGAASLVTLAMFAVLTSHSRGAALAGAVGAAALYLLVGAWRDRRSTARLTAVLALGLVCAMVFQLGLLVVEEVRVAAGRPTPVGPVDHLLAAIDRMGREISDRTGLRQYDSHRFAAQAAGLRLAWRYPLGVGPGQFSCFAGMDPHNLFVRALVENGWIGLLSLVAWLAVLWTRLWDARNRTDWPVAPAALLALLASLLVHSLVISTLHWRHFWLILGVSTALARQGATRSDATRCVVASPQPAPGPRLDREQWAPGREADCVHGVPDGPVVSPWVLSGLKRAFDVVLAGLGLLVSVPIWVFIMLAIVAEDGRPVLYTQARLGMGGRPFTLLKFRSMTRDAERTTGPVLASASDPRVTRVGRLLRATAMDELPQLVNIFLGHMSFVGPRPERPELVAEIVVRCPEFARRQAVRPGLTGPAQVFGHYETDPAEKLAYDLDYIRKATFWGDVRLILRSFWITFTARWQERSGHLSQPAQPAARRQINRKSAADDK